MESPVHRARGGGSGNAAGTAAQCPVSQRGARLWCRCSCGCGPGGQAGTGGGSGGGRPGAGDRGNGMTLVEMSVTVAVIAMAMAIIIPAISNLTWAELRESASKLSGLIRHTYDNAALSGQTQRLTFDFESKVIAAEATEQVLNFEPDSNVLAESKRNAGDLTSLFDIPEDFVSSLEDMDEAEEEQDEAPEIGALAAFLNIGSLGSMGGMAGEGAFTAMGEPFTLAGEARLLDVWIQGMNEPATEGKVYLYFFPHGFTQDALIHLEDVDGRVFTVKVWALTGKTEIFGEYVEVPK